MTWATLEQARTPGVWPDAPTDDEVLRGLLEDAHAACSAYAPTLAAGAPVPAGYWRAEVLQAREIWAASKRDGGIIGFTDTYAVRARVLTDEVRALLRPRRAAPKVR